MFTKLKSIALGATVATGAFLVPSFADAQEQHTVESGDTLYLIGQDYGVTVDEMVEANTQLPNPDLIYPNDTVIVPVTSVTTNESTVTEDVEKTTQTNTDVTASELVLLERLVHAEAWGQPVEGKKAVVDVVLNRVESDEFPNSIEGVVHQSGQFTPVATGAIHEYTPSDKTRDAVQSALNTDSRVGNSLYFYNPATATNRWLDSLETVTVIGDHTFKK
ncbi:cell wall hydrolase [Geomicrobium sp. JCM 19055]|uniref:cell wall hydrolase n=1 Tax=Geomicrobium sp. JCM 19055 TaxID=1460649 RepID=UPI00045EDD37|nr:cell wall hydrolase [Geomicrobium sp. JCM 19055]GAK00868.1 spore cortex-lytic enzyme, lytic transglycosylase SleB [Geomicrobium sp. JCM 19055]